MFIVFDLDGTLANCFERAYKHLACPQRGYPHTRRDMDWDAFFAACEMDTPFEHMINLMKTLHSAGEEVEIWTGRSDAAREKTELWLLKHGVPKELVGSMKMRPDRDHRDDNELKEEWMNRFGKPDIVFEDRRRVVDMWRRHGVLCCQVADANF